MILSSSHFDSKRPYWQDYLPFLHQLEGQSLPSCAILNALLRKGLKSAGGHAIQFVDSELLGDGAYENRIFTSGRVSTRKDNWHDLFNALVWMRFPRIKTAINSLHYRESEKRSNGQRGRLRDALTLFDECGVIVFSNRLVLLRALAQRHWSEAFLADDFSESVGLSINGHAMLEKYLSPYKAMTAKALLVHADAGFMRLPRQEALERLDLVLSRAMLDGRVLTRPSDLSPLPLAGVPGWWPQDEQSQSHFYADLQVFRPPPKTFSAAPILSL